MTDPSLFEDYLNQKRSFGFAEPGSSFLPQTQGTYEDIAGLEPLPLQRMLQQIGRPFTQLYNQIERARQTPWAYKPKEIKEMLAPNPQRTEQVLRRAQAVEKIRQTWDPFEAEWKERMNKSTTTPRSKPSQASFDAFSGVVRTVSKDLFDTLNKQRVSYGVLGDISDYLQPGQLEVIRTGVIDQLNQGVSPSKIIRRGSGGNINTGRGHVGGAVKSIIEEYLSNEKESKPKSSPLSILDRYREQMRLTEPPLIIPGVSNQFEGV